MLSVLLYDCLDCRPLRFTVEECEEFRIIFDVSVGGLE